MGVITLLDLVQDAEFRLFVEQKIARETTNYNYHFQNKFPILYKYQSLSVHAVDNIVNEVLSTTRIGEFNDLFDGALHQYGTDLERQKAAEGKWEELEQLRKAANLPEGLLEHDTFINLNLQNMKTTSRLKFRQLDYLGTYVSCLSSDMASTLMWSHYANSNTGICVGYDFNSPEMPVLLKKMVFPVAYSKTPINTRDLLEDTDGKIYKYPLDAAVMCAALNKGDVWQYEKEWRFVFVSYFDDNRPKYFPIQLHIHPSSISFGYHFMKSFFYSDNSEIEKAEKQIKLAIRLLEYSKEKSIPISVMVPSVGEYRLYPATISASALISFMHDYFCDYQPKNVRYYYTLHDRLMNLIEEERENA